MKKLKLIVERVKSFFSLFSNTQLILPAFDKVKNTPYESPKIEDSMDPKVVILHNPGSIAEPKIDTLHAIHSNGGKKHVSVEIKKKVVVVKNKKPASKKKVVSKNKKKQARKRK